MSQLQRRVTRLESAAPPSLNRETFFWIREDETGPVTNMTTGETLSAAEWAEYEAETEALDVLNVLITPPGAEDAL